MSKDPEGWAFDFGCILHDNFNSDAVARIAVPFSAHGFRFAGTARPKTGFGMELLERLLFGSDSLWGGGVAHSVMILALGIAAQPVVTLLVCVLLTAMLPTAEMGVRKWFM